MSIKSSFINQVQDELRKEFLSIKDDEKIIFGAGRNGVVMFNELDAIGYGDGIVCFVDNSKDKIGTSVCGLDIMSPKDAYEKYPKATWIIGSTDYSEEINTGLKKQFGESIKIYMMQGFLKGLYEQLALYRRDVAEDTVAYVIHWFDVYEKMDKDGNLQKYIDEIKDMLEDEVSKAVLDARFDFFRTGNIESLRRIPNSETDYHSDYFMARDDEVYYDIGSYTGDTVFDFSQQMDGKYKSILAFEPDSENYRMMNELIEREKIADVKTYKKAVGKEKGVLFFAEEGRGNSRLSESGGVEVEVTTIDSFMDEKPTFIHMDVEGAEIDAIEGGAKTIATYKPRLSISIYHRPLDFYEIPKLLKKINPEYKFKIRQHHSVVYDMILYAE